MRSKGKKIRKENERKIRRSRLINENDLCGPDFAEHSQKQSKALIVLLHRGKELRKK